MMKKNVFVLLFVITIIIGIATPAFAERLKYTGLARSEGGAVLASATVAVYLAGTTTPADVYEASSGGTSVNEVTTDSNGRWTFYADTTDYAFTQEYKVVVTKDGYSSITLDNIFILRLPTNAVGVLTNDGSGNYTWSAASFSESGDYSPTGTWDWSGATVSGLNATGLKLADDSTLTLPAAAPTAEGLPITCNNSDSTCSFATGFSSITIGGGTASTVAAWDGSGNLGSLSTQNMLTTGTVSGKVPIITKSDSYTLGTDSAQEAYGYMVFMSGDGKILTLPAVVAGMSVCVYSTDATAKVVDPNASDGIRNGTAARNADGHAITSDAGAGSFVCLIADSADGWTVLGKAGTWTDE